MRLKSGLPWRTQDTRGIRAVGFLMRRAANWEWKQSKRKKKEEETKLKEVGDLRRALTLDMKMKSLEFVQIISNLV